MRRRYRRKPKAPQRPRYRVNEYIRIPRILVIDETGEMLGEMSNIEALEL